MAIHKDFPKSPYAILDPAIRWFPADEALREGDYDKLLPPLVSKLRREVADWRTKGYEGASETSRALLRWWFETEHPIETSEGITDFRYYFAQREAVETIIYCYEVAKVKNKYDLMNYDSSGAVSASMFHEEWLRMVIKMATGSGKTKVMSLLIAWSYFHKLYEADSRLARNFLMLAPNIIVLDRLRHDFDNLKIFRSDPILPDNGFEGQNWVDDFNMKIHIQDNVGTFPETGNIFLTNIQRIYSTKDKIPSFDDEDTTDYFLNLKAGGPKANLAKKVRNLSELVILNDEAHHIHEEKLAWFKSIEDISNTMKMNDRFLSLQIDVTATPKRNNGAIFVQTVSDYPLVEAIYQNVVKHPVIPDKTSRKKLQEHKSSKFTEKYRDYIHLGYLEWKSAFTQHEKMDKKAVFFVMTDDTTNCNEVARYLIDSPAYPEFQSDKDVLVIHTKSNDEIADDNLKGARKEKLEKLRAEANAIDDKNSSHKAIISVLMLKEGWDTKNVTTIVGLRPYKAPSNILPEQTLGRGLRRMYSDSDVTELVSVVGTKHFMEFVEAIRSEGVELEEKPMGAGTAAKAPLVIEVDHENARKDIAKLDIDIPVLSPRIYREYKNLADLDVSAFSHKKVAIKEFSEDDKKQIDFWHMAEDKLSHTRDFDANFIPNYQSAIGYYVYTIRKDLRLVGKHDILYEKIKEFVVNFLFEQKVDLENLNILRNLSETEVERTIVETFKKEINLLTVADKGTAEIRDHLRVSQSRPFVENEQGFVVPRKSVFNKIIGDSEFELQVAGFFEDCDDIVSYAKNYNAVRFKIDYKSADGNIRNYRPDFFVKVSEKEIYIVETKGREDLDDIEKIKRLHQWCADINSVQTNVKFTALYVKQEQYEKYPPKTFAELVKLFGEA